MPLYLFSENLVLFPRLIVHMICQNLKKVHIAYRNTNSLFAIVDFVSFEEIHTKKKNKIVHHSS